MTNENFEAINAPGFFIRHRVYLGELTRFASTVEDFSFTLVRRGEHEVAIRSVNFPDLYLRHRDFRIHLEGPATPQDLLFGPDSSFHLEHGLADHDGGVSFRSFNFPDRYLRHRDFHLWVEPPSGPDDQQHRQDATFRRRPAAGLID